jgi:hypothetical protein
MDTRNIMTQNVFSKIATAPRPSKNVKFMGENVQIRKLTVSEVTEIRKLALAAEKAEAEADLNIDLLVKVIKCSVEDAAEIDEGEFLNFPLEELQKLSTEIMTYSGFGEAKK